MKKILLLATLAILAACSENDLNQAEPQQQNAENAGILFDVYSQRNITRGGGQLGDLTNKNIGKNGFGVFAYYTDGDVYGPSAKPDFMYNQQVRMADPSAEATLGSTQWVYEPVKYWPNEFGSAAIADGVDYVSFFAYAPWTKVDPTTGSIIVPDSIKSADSIAVWQNKNIIAVNRNADLGDPLVKYRVDTNPATSVDLLWGVASPLANDAYGPIDGTNGSQKQNKDVTIKVGEPFLNLVKPNDPANDKLLFNLKHALAKVKITVDYIDDAATPTGPAAQKMDLASTRIFVREFKISGWAMEGALNLNNTDMPGEPNWKSFDGKSELAIDDELTFYDGRKDPDAEGKKSGEAKSEKPQGLNPLIIENYDTDETIGQFGEKKNPGVAAMSVDDEGNITLTAEPVATDFTRVEGGKTMQAFVGTQLLFGGDPTKNGGFFYVIPRNSNNEGVNVEIAYDVETIDKRLASTISDGLNHGISVANVIRKQNIFGEGVDFKAGYQYVINLHLGMTSVKIDADVQPWIDTDTVDVNLPGNQDPSGKIGRLGILPPAETEVGLIHTYTVTPATGTTPAVTKTINLTFTSDGKFRGGYMSGTIAAGDGTTAEDLEAAGIDDTKTYYIPATAEEGDIFEVLTFEGDASRRMEEEAETETKEKGINFLTTNIFVKVDEVTQGDPTINPNVKWTLSLESAENGTITSTPDAGQISENKTVKVEAKANEGYHFVAWIINDVEDVNHTIANPYEFKIAEDTKIGAKFEADTQYFALTLIQPQNGKLESDAADNSKIAEGTPVTIKATPDDGYVLSGLTVGGEPVTASADGKYTFLMEKETEVTAEFEVAINYYELTLTAPTNGTLQSDTDDNSKIAEGESVTVTAAPNAGYELASLTVGGSQVTLPIENNQYTFTMNGNTTVTAVFEAMPVLTLGSVTNGTIQSNPAAGSIAKGSEVILTANPSSGYKLKNWTIGSTTVSPNEENPNTYTFNITNDVTVSAEFEKITYTITATSKNQAGTEDETNSHFGTVTLSSDGPYDSGTSVTVTAKNKRGYEFTRLEDNGSAVTVQTSSSTSQNVTTTTATYTISNISSNHALTAVYTGLSLTASGVFSTTTSRNASITYVKTDGTEVTETVSIRKSSGGTTYLRWSDSNYNYRAAITNSNKMGDALNITISRSNSLSGQGSNTYNTEVGTLKCVNYFE